MKQPKLQFHYKFEKQTGVANITVTGKMETPSLILQIFRADEDTMQLLVSYLNQLSNVIEKWKGHSNNFLKASLTGSQLTWVQEEVSRDLGYSTLGEFIEEIANNEHKNNPKVISG